MEAREKMLWEIEHKYGLKAPRVFVAMKDIPREKFIPQGLSHLAYKDMAIAIGWGQTISQPYTVAFMTSLILDVDRKRVLEIGTGSGYQAAVLSKLFEKVYSVEIIKPLADSAEKTLQDLGFANIYIKKGSGEAGWKENAPYNAIVVTAGLKAVPQALLGQLVDGGVLLAPVGKGADKAMTRFIKKKNEFEKEEFGSFAFVPFIREN